MRWSAVVVLSASLAGGCGRLGYGAEELRSAADGGMDAGPSAPRPDGGLGGHAAGECGDGSLSGDEVCDDGNTVGGDGCSADCTRRELCGDGVLSADELCDDGNSVNGDGCDNDCSPSCATNDDCDDEKACNGEETCSDGVCAPGAMQPDGTSCDGAGVCRAGSCAPATCGNLVVDSVESCDDGNTTEGDGCDNDCTFSCAGEADCDDGNACNGLEDCDDAVHVCMPGEELDPGTPCDRDADPETRDICLAATCVASRCGDAFVDDAEDCDDGNGTNGDGCDNDCTFSCVESSDCDDGLVCNGSETCMENRCTAGTPAPDGTSCPGGTCLTGSCRVLTPADGGITGGGMCGTEICSGRERCCCNSCVPIGVECLDVKCPSTS